MIKSLLSVADAGGDYIELPHPSAYTATPNETVKAMRNVQGNLYKYRISVKRTIEVSWNAVTPAQKATIVNLTKGNSFYVKYYDTQDGAERASKFYRGNDTVVTGIPPWDGTDFRAYNIIMTLVEF